MCSQRARRMSGQRAGKWPASAPASVAVGVSYRVSFAAVQVVKATDIQDAIRQAQSLGATEILQVERA